MSNGKWFIICLSIILIAVLMVPGPVAHCQPQIPVPRIGVSVDAAETPEDVAFSLQVLFLLTVLSLAPAILIMLTSFTRVIVILSFIRSAMGTQQMPPNQVLIGLALFLTFFIMMPVGNQINEEAIQPYLAQEITQEQAIENAKVPLREFMLKHTRNKDLALFVSMSGNNPSETIDEIPTRVIVPAFIISELKTAFQIGFLLYVPFIIIDMVVASTLMSMGMMMLPPVMISLPFKILLFIMVDGWNLVVRTIISGFK